MERFPCVMQDICPLRDTRKGCFEDVHHKVYPRRAYQRGIAAAYRELDENKELTCRWRHNEVHASQEPPERLPIEEMHRIVNEAAGRAATYGETEMAG